MPTRKPIPDVAVPVIDPASGRFTKIWYDYFKVNDSLGVGGLFNVDGTDIPADGEVLTFDSTNSRWNSEAIPAVADENDLVFLSTQVAFASATIDFTTGLDDTYDAYLIELSNVKPATDNVSLFMRIGVGAGPTYKSGASDYQWETIFGATSESDTADSEMHVTAASGAIGNATAETLSGTVKFSNPESSSEHCLFRWDATWLNPGTTQQIGRGAGSYYGTAEAITGIRFLMSSGNIASGRFSLYGYKKS